MFRQQSSKGPSSVGHWASCTFLLFAILFSLVPNPIFGDVLLRYHLAKTTVETHQQTRHESEEAVTLRLAARQARIDVGPHQSCIVDLNTAQTFFLFHKPKKFERHPHPTTFQDLMCKTEEGKRTYDLIEEIEKYTIVPGPPKAPRNVGDRRAYNYHFTVSAGTDNRFDYNLWLSVDVPLREEQIQLYKALRSSCAIYTLDSGSVRWIDTLLTPDAVELEFERKHTDRTREITTQRRLEEVEERPTDPRLFRPPLDYQEKEFDPSRYMVFKVFTRPPPKP